MAFIRSLLLFINVIGSFREFRLKMHFVPLNMLRKKSPSCLQKKKAFYTIFNNFFSNLNSAEFLSNHAHDAGLKQ